MQINMTVWGTGSTLINNKLRYKVYQADSPTAEVASLTEDPPHTFPHAVTINVPNPVVHIVKIYTTPDESLGSLISEFIYDPTYTNVEVRMPLELSVGGPGEFDPADGAQSTPVIPSLRGWEWYPEMRSKSGTLSITEYTKNESVPGEGYDSYSLIGDDRFVNPDYVFIHFKPKISVQQPVFTYLNFFNGVKVITGDDNMDATYYRQLCEIATAGPSPVITLLPKINIPDNTLLVFSTKRGSQKQATLKLSVGESIDIDGVPEPAIFMGQGETLWLLLKDNIWRIANDWNGMSRVGEQVDLEIMRPNTILFNGGGLADGGGGPLPLPRAIYPRAGWYVDTKLPSGQVLTKAARDAGGINLSGFWAIDDDNIWAPDYQGNQRRALPGNRGNDSSRNASSLAGSYAPDMYKQHTHFTVKNQVNTQNSPFPDPPLPNRPIAREWNKQNGSGPQGYYLVGADIDAVPDLGPTSKSGGGETIGKTNGVYMGCYI
jgi:hypothetical protein